MIFGAVVGNPPFNAPSKNRGPAGTSGNTVLYKKFIDLSLSLSPIVALVVQRNGIRYANQQTPISKYCLDTDRHWEYAAGWFVRDDTSQQNLSHDPIIQKVYCLEEQWQYSAPLSGNYDSNTNHWPESRGDDVYGVVDTPTMKHSEVRRAWFKQGKRNGVQLLFKGLESRKSYVVVDEPTNAGSTGVLFFDTVADAERAKLVILNNPVIAHLKRITGERTLAMVFRYVKTFELSQIVTGKEIPHEWNLTMEDLEKIKFKRECSRFSQNK